MTRNIVLGVIVGLAGFALLIWPGYRWENPSPSPSESPAVSPTPTPSVSVSPTPTPSPVVIQPGLTKEEVEEILNELVPTVEEITARIKEELSKLNRPTPLPTPEMPAMPNAKDIQKQIQDKLDELRDKFDF